MLFTICLPGRCSYRFTICNLISKALQNPLHCHGYSLFDDGRMVLFRYESAEPTRVHPMQVWLTPYHSDEYAAQRPTDTSALGRIGNADLVRGISDAYSIQRMIREAEPSIAVYEDLIAATNRMVDDYHWLGQAELGNLRQQLAREAMLLERLAHQRNRISIDKARDGITDHQLVVGEFGAGVVKVHRVKFRAGHRYCPYDLFRFVSGAMILDDLLPCRHRYFASGRQYGMPTRR